VFGNRSRRGRRGSGGAWTASELNVQDHLRQFLAQLAQTSMPIAAGISAVIFAPDRDRLLAAIEDYPELLTDPGSAAFEAVALMTTMLGEARVTEAVQRSQASVQAIAEART
jgi:hypothetical protein